MLAHPRRKAGNETRSARLGTTVVGAEMTGSVCVVGTGMSGGGTKVWTGGWAFGVR